MTTLLSTSRSQEYGEKGGGVWGGFKIIAMVKKTVNKVKLQRQSSAPVLFMKYMHVSIMWKLARNPGQEDGERIKWYIWPLC